MLYVCNYCSKMCKRYPGFMRVALQDPQPERRFLRRGWVTFDRTVNIVDICWNLNNIRVSVLRPKKAFQISSSFEKRQLQKDIWRVILEIG